MGLLNHGENELRGRATTTNFSTATRTAFAQKASPDRPRKPAQDQRACSTTEHGTRESDSETFANGRRELPIAASSAERIVHVALDDEMLKARASATLSGNGFTVRSWADAGALLRAIRSLAPGCLILDARQPEPGGLDVQARLREWNMVLPIVMLTSRGDVRTAVSAVKAGLVEIIEEPLERDALVDAVNRSFEALERLIDLDREHIEAHRLLARLTSREFDVLKGLAAGLPNKTIAYDLGISPRTVEVYRANIMEKLHARSLSDVLRVAFAAKLQ